MYNDILMNILSSLRYVKYLLLILTSCGTPKTLLAGKKIPSLLIFLIKFIKLMGRIQNNKVDG